MPGKILAIFYVCIGITDEQEGNASVGRIRDEGVLVHVVREGGGWVKDREGQVRVQVARVS